MSSSLQEETAIAEFKLRLDSFNEGHKITQEVQQLIGLIRSELEDMEVLKEVHKSGEKGDSDTIYIGIDNPDFVGDGEQGE